MAQPLTLRHGAAGAVDARKLFVVVFVAASVACGFMQVVARLLPEPPKLTSVNHVGADEHTAPLSARGCLSAAGLDATSAPLSHAIPAASSTQSRSIPAAASTRSHSIPAAASKRSRSTPAASSTQSHSIPAASASHSTPCPLSGSLAFKNSASIVGISDLDLPGDFTIEWWARQRGQDGFQRLISFYSAEDAGVLLGVSLEPDVYLWVRGSSARVQNYSTTARVGWWQHWAVVRSGSEMSLYYITGKLRVTVGLDGRIGGPGTTFFIGGRDSMLPESTNFDGRVASFRVVAGSALYLYVSERKSHAW